jgi:hypothetical protein
VTATVYDDPNRESVGLAPIWTGAGEDPPPPEGDTSARSGKHKEPAKTAAKSAAREDDAEET